MDAIGSCNCGEVKFEIRTPLSDVYLCHCSICRKSTGAGAIAVVLVNANDFSWTQGHDSIKTWKKPKHDWQTNFCNRCGSPLPGKNDAKAVYIPVSLLDSGYQHLKIRHHLFVDSKASWETTDNAAKLHNNNFEK